MPRIGIVCPVDGADVADHACLTCRTGAPRAGAHCHFSYEMLKGMMDSSGRATAHISATMLTTVCPRRVWLEPREDYHVSPLRLFPAWRGTMGHLMTEAHPAPDVIYERRFEVQLEIAGEPVRVTGQIDKLDIRNRRIEDFKTKADAKIGKLREPELAHVWQLNIYRFLVMHGWPQQAFTLDGMAYKPGTPAGIAIDELKLTYWSMQEPKALAAPVLDEGEVTAFIHARAAGLIGDCPPVPDHLDPYRDKLCVDWCPVRQHCLVRNLGF